jgi:hypothetical protein
VDGIFHEVPTSKLTISFHKLVVSVSIAIAKPI